VACPARTQPRLLDHFHALFASKPINECEVIAGRAYTGPLYVKMNGSLRKASKKFGEQAHLKCNSYTNLIYACNSLLRKFSEISIIPPGRKVSRGMSGVILPGWEVTGEPFFMNTDKGEVTVYPARINCNLKSKTIEEIKGHRQKEILAMLPYLKGALQRDMPVLVEALAADFKEKNEETQLKKLYACQEKKEEAAALLTEATKDAATLDVQDTKYKRSALHYASSSGLESIVAKLLSLGADVALKDECGKTALDVATNDKVKAALRQHGARHSLFYAAEEGMLELVADLIKEGADVNERDQAGNTAVERAQNSQTIDVLKGAGATMPEFPEENKNDLLIKYAEKGATGGLLMALQAGADVNHKDLGDSRAALHWAAICGMAAEVDPHHEALAQGLLGAGADVNAKDEWEYTPLLLAAFWNKPEIAKVLLAHGAQVNARTNDGRTALAIARCKHEMEALLRQHGAE